VRKKAVETGRRRPLAAPRVSVNAYYRNRASDTSPDSPFEGRRPPKVLKKLVIRSLDTLFFVAVAVAIIASLLVSPVSQVVVTDSTYHAPKEYAEFINSKLGQFTDRNKITFDELGLRQAIAKAFPEVVTTSVELPIIGQKPVIRLNIAAPAFFIRSGGDEYLLSGNGVTVDLKSYYPKLAGLPTIDDESGFNLAKGKHVLSQQDINFLQTIVAEVKHQNVPLAKVVLPKSPEEADLYSTDAPYYTKFFMGGDAGIQVGQYLAARNNFKAQNPPDQYLDVRVSGKVFFR
jgi:hypothetical protein